MRLHHHTDKVNTLISSTYMYNKVTEITPSCRGERCQICNLRLVFSPFFECFLPEPVWLCRDICSPRTAGSAVQTNTAHRITRSRWWVRGRRRTLQGIPRRWPTGWSRSLRTPEVQQRGVLSQRNCTLKQIQIRLSRFPRLCEYDWLDCGHKETRLIESAWIYIFCARIESSFPSVCTCCLLQLRRSHAYVSDWSRLMQVYGGRARKANVTRDFIRVHAFKPPSLFSCCLWLL